MTAEIDAENFLLKGQYRLLRIFCCLRHTDLKFLFIFFRRNIKKTQLSCHGMLLILVDTVYDLRINRHFLIPVSLQAIQRSGLDQIFHNSLVDLVDISLNKCFQ